MDVIFTVCNRYTQANALVLAESVNRHMPLATFYFCWVDDIELLSDTGEIKVLSVDEIDIPNFDDMRSRYYDFELVAACRPWFASYLLGRVNEQDDVLTFLSPTTWLLTPIAPLSDESELMLKVNISKPLQKDKHLDDKRILNIGMHHSGTWSVRKRETTERFFEWWSSRTIDRAKFDLCNGMCMDQLWLNYAPIWIRATSLNRSASWHYGLHSIINHELVYTNSGYIVVELPLVSVDFAGMQVFDPVWSDYKSISRRNKAFITLFANYKNEVKKYLLPRVDTSQAGYGVNSVKKLPNPLLRNSVVLLDRIAKFIDDV
jgi:hypothetical protein